MPAAPPRTPDVWVILPTYNEAENLERIVTAVFEHLPPSRRILIVDDNSPDGTGEIADRLAAEDESVAVLHRPIWPDSGSLLTAAPSGSSRWTRTSLTIRATSRL